MVTVTNAGAVAGDEVVEAYVKTPQPDGPIHSLVGFERVHIAAGATTAVKIRIDPRSISSVDNQGNRTILAGKYKLSIGGAQPEETQSKSEVTFTVTGTAAVAK
jgi:beta-glucosidase